MYLTSTKTFNHTNVVIHNFTIEYRIECEKSGLGRDKYVRECLEEITFAKKPDSIIELPKYYPDNPIAAALEMLDINYRTPWRSDLEPVSDAI